MSDPRIDRQRGLFIVGACVAAIVVVVATVDLGDGIVPGLALGVIGAVLLFGIIHTASAQRDLRKLRRLRERGDAVHWIVDDERWSRFAALDIHAQKGAIAGHHRRATPPVEVDIADELVAVGGFLIDVTPGPEVAVVGPLFVDGPAPYLEYRFTSDYHETYLVRAPVAREAEAMARARWPHADAPQPGSPSR